MADSKWIKSEVRPLAAGRALTEDVDNLSIADATAAYRMLDFVEKKIKPRKEELRLLLLAYAEQKGKKTDKGGQEVQVDGHRVLREKRVSKLPDEEGVKKLLAEAEIGLKEAFDEVKTLQLNPSKLDFLMQTGRIDKARVEPLHDVKWALRVFGSEELQELLESAGSVNGNGNGNGKSGRRNGR